MKKRIVAVFMTVMLMIAVLFVSSTVAFAKKTTLKITKQPVSVKVLSGKSAKVTVKAKGDGLTYKWYYKNKGAKKYTLAKTAKKSTYTAKMKSSVNGRKVYCVVTDKYGKTVKTKAVTLSAGTAVKITKKPASVTASCGSTAKASVTAKGDGLTYQWYYKNSGAKKYTRAKSAKGKTYSVKMTPSVNGRRVYCVIKDAYGKTVQTKSVKLSLKHAYDSGSVTKKATCLSTGTKVYTCKGCKATKKETLKKTDHSYAGWKTYTEATVTEKGVQRNKCKVCNYYKDRSTDKLKAVYYITVNTGSGKAEKVGVASDGKYSLKNPVKVGYNFKGWKDSSGNAFASSGVSKKNVTVTAQWELDGTNTLAELTERTDAGVSEIKITGNITVNKPLFISRQTKIYSDADYTIKRDPSYKGDIFVVGRDRNGKMASTVQQKAVLNLGGGKGTLIIDGNRDNLKVTVVGSALFVADSSVVNIYDGVKIVNNKKTGNERALTYIGDVTGSIVEKAGGAAIINLNSTVNIHGGTIDNNMVVTEHTVVENDDGTKTYLETNGCGGAIFNLGNINMYGGTVSNSEALRGGGIYSGRVLYLFAGKLSGNTGYAYGGAVATSSSADADTFIGDADGKNEIIFENNHSKTGGALYSNTSSPIIIYGKARFTGNTSSGSGGAIHTAGPLTVRGSVFENNSAVSSGGAIYHYYTKESFERRDFELTGCEMKNNSASLGGAVILSASDSVSSTGLGTYAKITDCDFTDNKAIKNESNVGNGGAIYITRKSEAVINDCSFARNTAANIAGAVAVQSTAKASISDSDFTENQAVSGGGINASAGTVLTMKNLKFTGNKAVKKESGSEGNGGALYLHDMQPTFENVDFEGNSAENHAGAVYLAVSDISIDSSCSFVGNSAAKHGGAFYLTYKTNSDSTKDGAVLNATGVNFENNSALAGGAISARTACTANLNGVTLKGNSVEGYDNKADGDGEGGGAVYVGYGDLSLTNVTATGNTASDFGGVIDAAGAEVTVTGGSFTGNKSNNGGLLYACGDSKVTLTDADVNENESVYVNSDYNNLIGGGAISTKSSKLDISNCRFDGNKTGYYGGAIHANKTEVTIDEATSFVNSQGGTGAALYFVNSCKVNLENITVSNNTAKQNGTVYVNGGTLTMKNITATGNNAINGGILYISGASTQVNILNNTWKGNSATTGGIAYIANATVNVTDCTFEENTANIGGVAFVQNGTLNTSDVRFLKNSAVKKASGSAGNGGAVSMEGGTFNVSPSDIFTENTAENHGGAVYVSYYTNEKDQSKTGGTLIANGGIFGKNSAMGGGAISIRTNGSAVLTGTTLSENSVTGDDGKNDGDGEGGGAVYVGYGALTLNNVTVNGNTAGSPGGAVDVLRSTLSVNGSNFSGNTGTADGGAIYLSTSSQADIRNAKFTSNEAKQGGAVFGYKSTSVALSDVSFEGNKATSNGGALYLYNVPMTSENTDFNSNISSGNGGAAYLCATEMTVGADSEFKNNSAAKHGGAVYLTYMTVDNAKVGAVLNATDTVFENNSAMAGGAVSVRTDCTANLSGVTLNSNRVEGFDNKAEGDGEGGGAVYVGYGELNLTDVTATGNTASDFGGVVDAAGATVKVNGGTFTGNSSNAGGVIYALSGSVVDVNGADFKENESVFVQDTSAYNSVFGGGAINAKGGTLNIKNSEFDGNKSKYYGGTIHTSKTTVSISENTVIKNSEGATGAALYFRDASVVTMTDTSLEGNKSTSNGVIYHNGGTLDMTNVTAKENDAYNGGVLFVSSVSTKVYLKNSEWSLNTATYGGAVCVNDATVYITNSEIGTNVANYGGAVYIKNGTVNTESTSFAGNHAVKTSSGSGGYGGAVSMEAGTMNAGADTLFTDNYAASHGGAVFASFLEDEKTEVITGSALNVNGADFSSNRTEANGGAVYVNSECGAVIENAAFTSNEAVNGGALYVSSVKPISMNGVSFEGNKASSNGGAVSVYHAPVTAVNTDFISNTSNNHGGAVYLCGTEMSTDAESEFSSNSAKNHGGAIYVVYFTNEDKTKTGAVLNANGTVFENNSALGGGAVSVRTDSTANFDGAAFTGNTTEGFAGKNDGDGEGGGAVYVGYGTVNFKNVNATGNEAKASLYVNENSEEKLYGFGGFIDALYADISIEGGVISGNKAPSGGAVNVIGSANTLSVNGTSFTANESTYINDEHDSTKGGGAIYFKGGELNITGAAFEGNKAGFYGGAVMASNATVKIDESSSFTGNEAGTGAAVYFVNSSAATLENSLVTNNKSDSNGVIYVNGSTLDMRNVSATGNTATNGGVLYASGAGTRVKLENSTWSGNSANVGGTMSITDATVTVTGCTFSENSAQLGGAINNSRGTVTLSGNKFERNSAVLNKEDKNGNGGAITLSGGNAVADGTNSFVSNTAAGHGGAIYVSYANNSDGTKTPGVLTMGADTLEGNSAIAGGAISSRTECEVYLTGTVLKGNSATSANGSEGGGAIFTNNNFLVLSGVTIDGNSTGYYGGAVTALSADVTVKDNSVIKNNTGITGVAFNFRDACNVTLTDISVKDNISTAGSGVIYATGTTKMNINGLTATGNKNNNGGVIYTSSNADVTVASSTFEGNTAVSYGGAIDQRSAKKMTVSGTTFKGNSAGISGGAIHGMAEVEITDCTFENNSAKAEKKSDTIARGGGAIFVRSGKTVTVNGGSFTSNSAAGTSDSDTMTDAGGAILVDGGSLNVTNASFNSNTANNGGAIGTSKAKETAMNITGCTFTGNTSTKNGGGVYVQNGIISDTDTIVVKDCSFINNTASTASGSAVYIRTASSAKVINLKASGGKVSYKGAVYATSGARVTLEGTVELAAGEEVFVTGSGTSAVVNYKTEAEKNAWSDAITTASSAKVTYVSKA